MKLAGNIIALALGGVLLNFSLSEAQQPKKLPRIGYANNTEETFRQGLRELCYVEGQNITIGWAICARNPRSGPTKRR